MYKGGNMFELWLKKSMYDNGIEAILIMRGKQRRYYTEVLTDTQAESVHQYTNRVIEKGKAVKVGDFSSIQGAKNKLQQYLANANLVRAAKRLKTQRKGE